MTIPDTVLEIGVYFQRTRRMLLEEKAECLRNTLPFDPRSFKLKFRIHYCPQTKFAKVMFLQVSVCPQGGVHGGGGMRGWGVCMAGGHAWKGACMTGGVCGRGSMHGRGCAWQGMHAPPRDTTRYGQ